MTSNLRTQVFNLVLMVTYSITGATVETLEDRINSALAELRSRMEADSAEATAGTEAIRQAGPTITWCREEMDEKLGEMVHSTNERFVTVVERQEKADTQREEALAEIREELEGLNGKIEEVLPTLEKQYIAIPGVGQCGNNNTREAEGDQLQLPAEAGPGSSGRAEPARRDRLRYCQS